MSKRNSSKIQQMEGSPYPPARAPPPVPPKDTRVDQNANMESAKFAVRLVRNNAAAGEDPSSLVPTDDIPNSWPPTSDYAQFDEEHHTLVDTSQELGEPLRQPPSPPSHQQLNGHSKSPSITFQKLASPKDAMTGVQRSDSPRIVLPDESKENRRQSRNVSHGSTLSYDSNDSRQSGHSKSASATRIPAELTAELPYHHRPLSEAYVSGSAGKRSSHNLYPGPDAGPYANSSLAPAANLRPTSSYSSLDSDSRGRSGSPNRSPYAQGQSSSVTSPIRRSPDSRPLSYIDLLNVPYPQQAPTPMNFDNAHLKTSVGNNASLLSPMKTLEMYRANVKKTNDLGVQYQFALFMLDTAQKAAQNPSMLSTEQDEKTPTPAELIKEARQILQRLSDRSYPFAQYFLADGYASGLFNKGKEDNDRAFPLFVAASKRGHCESGYRAALSYEFGWGTRKDPMKAVQFYRQSASKGHPGAMTRFARACLTGDLGLGVQYKEGIKWLKRATESADKQYNTAPYELGLLHETGYGDDIFLDEQYAAQLFTQAADLGHVEANFKLGNAYEHGKLKCPKDPALSIHFYNGAASRGYAPAMMALCAWYMVGAGSVLTRDENEAYEWARKAAETGKCLDYDLEQSREHFADRLRLPQRSIRSWLL